MATLISIWGDIEAWLRSHAPEYLKALRPPASSEQLRAAQEAIGIPLPRSYLESVQIHDGQDGEMGLIGGWHLLPLSMVTETWTMLQDFRSDGTFAPVLERTARPDRGVRQTWWDEGWVPFAHDMAANHLCLDLNPTSEGRVGQVVTYFHDDTHRRIVAPDFGSWLERAARWMREGKVAVRDHGTGAIAGWDYSVRSLEYEGWDDDGPGRDTLPSWEEIQ